ncbi:hypothetical protein [Chroococcidiopsis sp.]|uniref:hypothetical protein n=1 Tax=Chroococcidiopsis sp. TaxID=3088168 RepID=UPI003F33465C
MLKQKNLKWYETDSSIGIIVLLVIFFPLGLWSMWKYASWSLKTKGMVTGICILVGLFNLHNNPSSNSTTSLSSPNTSGNSATSENRTFLGTSPTGYTLWKGSDGCIYVKNLTEGDLQRLGVSLGQLKDVIKQETGSRCVFFE